MDLRLLRKSTGPFPVPYVLEIASHLSYPSFMDQDPLIRPRKAAEMLAVSRSTIYRWFWEGKLRGVTLEGGTVRIFQSSVTEFLAAPD